MLLAQIHLKKKEDIKQDPDEVLISGPKYLYLDYFGFICTIACLAKQPSHQHALYLVAGKQLFGDLAPHFEIEGGSHTSTTTQH